MRVLVPGGGGYVGAMLVPHLLADGHFVTVYDTEWFGKHHLPIHNESMRFINGDVRHKRAFASACEGQDAVIYLASISNNAMCEKYPELAHSVNVSAFDHCVMGARNAGVKRFIYASSVAAYGSVKNAKEDSELAPTTPYGEGKAACEKVLASYGLRDFCTTIVRSASVFGYSLNMRFDLTLNKMIHDAMRKGAITVNGGNQKRCHISLVDICKLYKLLLAAPVRDIAGESFNAVCFTESVLDSAKYIGRVLNVPVNIKPHSDDRSYTVDFLKAFQHLEFIAEESPLAATEILKAHFDSGRWTDSMTNQHYLRMADGLS